MRTTHSFTRVLCLSSWLFAAISFLAVPSARAAYTMFVTQVGPNVVATGSGSMDITNLTPGSVGSGGSCRPEQYSHPFAWSYVRST